MQRLQRLSHHDLPAMRSINALFAEVFDDHASYSDAPPSDSWLAAQLTNPATIALAAYDEDALVGALTGYVLGKLEAQRSEIYIYDLAVRKSHRRRGVATALIGALNDVAQSVGAWVIYVQADYGDDAAIALYIKLGVREDVMHFDIVPG